MSVDYPRYLALGGPRGITVRFDKFKGKGAIYYRPAGAWSCYVFVGEQKCLYSVVTGTSNKVIAYVTTEEHFNEDNGVSNG